MTIADTLLKKILADAFPSPSKSAPSPLLEDDSIPEDDLLPPGIFSDAPDLDVFRQRAPDSGEAFPESPDSCSVLGTYTWMASPGVITLYQRNIDAYWRSLIHHARQQFPFVTTEDAKRMLQLLVHSVYQHERFHYVCDFSRRMWGGQFDRLHEEALAVAHEWQWLRAQDAWNTAYGRTHPCLRRIVVRAMFDHRPPGYRDWRQFANEATFHAAVTAYLHPASVQLFAGTNFNFGRWALAHVADDANKAWEEKIQAI